MSTGEYLNNYYNNYDEDGRLKTKHGLVEYLTTIKYIKKYLIEGMKICDIGAGTGRYSISLSSAGFKVDAVELVDSNIKVFKSNIEKSNHVTIRQGNALDLACFDNEQYDITLLLGPMYHLYNKYDKLSALKEALRVTKRGGILFVAYCIADASILGYGFKKGNILELIKNSMLDPDNFKTTSTPCDIFELLRKEDIDELVAKFNVERLHYVAADGYTNHMRETIENMNNETFDIYMNYHFSICEREDMVGLTHHSLDVLKKL